MNEETQEKLELNSVDGATSKNTTASKNLADNENLEQQFPNEKPNKSYDVQKEGKSLLQLLTADVRAGRAAVQVRKNYEKRTLDELSLADQLMIIYSSRFKQNPIELKPEKLEEICFIILESYGSLAVAAERIGIPTTQLIWHISYSPELQEVHKLALTYIKTINDKNLIEDLQSPDDEVRRWATNLVTRLLYKGRDKGGYNPAEIGTSGYEDAAGQQLADATKADREKKNIIVNFNLVPLQINDRDEKEEKVIELLEGDDYEIT